MSNPICRVVVNVSIAAVLLAASFTSGRADSSAELNADKQTIQPGESVTLTWKTSGTGAYLVGVGQVDAAGSVKVSPEMSRRYVLISQDGASVNVAKLKVTVAGEKGTEYYPELTDYTVQLPATENTLGFTPFIDRVFSTLQDKLKFNVRGDWMTHGSYVLAYTDSQTRPELVKPSENGVRYRRVSYAVEIYPPQAGDLKTVTFTVHAITDYQMLGDAEWHPDPAATTQDVAGTLKDLLTQAK